MDPDYLLEILGNDTEKNESFQEILNKIVWQPNAPKN